jgi:hypothetical protein
MIKDEVGRRKKVGVSTGRIKRATEAFREEGRRAQSKGG